MNTVQAAVAAAVWADDHAAQARRAEYHRLSGRLLAIVNELTEVAIGRRDPTDLSSLARTVLAATRERGAS